MEGGTRTLRGQVSFNGKAAEYFLMKEQFAEWCVVALHVLMLVKLYEVVL